MKKVFFLCFLALFFFGLIGCSSVPKDKMLDFQEGKENKSDTFFETFEQKIKKTDKKSLSDLNGEKILLIGCSVSNIDCVQYIPIFEKEIYKKYIESDSEIRENDKIFSVLLENYGSFFDTKIPQSSEGIFDVSSFFSSGCDLQPSWVLFDDKQRIIMKSCGSEKTIEDLQKEIEKL